MEGAAGTRWAAGRLKSVQPLSRFRICSVLYPFLPVVCVLLRVLQHVLKVFAYFQSCSRAFLREAAKGEFQLPYIRSYALSALQLKAYSGSLPRPRGGIASLAFTRCPVAH